jgi:hypothetical protein
MVLVMPDYRSRNGGELRRHCRDLVKEHGPFEPGLLLAHHGTQVALGGIARALPLDLRVLSRS